MNAPAQSKLLPQIIPFTFPLQGVSDVWGRVNQPAGSCVDCLNVMPYDYSGRGRGGSRPGWSQVDATQYGGGAGTPFAQWMGQVTAETSGARSQYLVLVAGAKVYYGTAVAALTAVAGSSGLSANKYCYGSAINGILYLVDGSGNLITVDFTQSPPVYVAYAATSGTSPAARLVRLSTVYRKRLVFFAEMIAGGNPQNFYMSRLGAPTDWNYGSPDPGAAVAGNAAKSGQPGDPITAMIAFGDDAMIIGCDRSLWIMNGDPADGGRIDLLNQGIGVFSQSAWCFDPAGDLYFVGTGGFYKMTRGSYTIENLSLDKTASYFSNLRKDNQAIRCLWDQDRHGAWIFMTPVTQGVATHYWYDERTKGFFPQQFPDLMGPLQAVGFDTGGADGRVLVMSGWGATGGTSGVLLYKHDLGAASDGGTTGLNGTAIFSYAWLGPLRPGSISQEAMIQAVDFVLGEIPTGLPAATSMKMSYILQAGRTANEAYNAAKYSASGSFTTAGRQTLQRNRVRGESFMLFLSNNTVAKMWSIEQIGAHVVPAGRVRK